MTEYIITNVKRDTKEGKYIFAVNMKDKVLVQTQHRNSRSQ